MFEKSIELAYLRLKTLCFSDYISLKEQSELMFNYLELLDLFFPNFEFQDLKDNENYKAILNILSPKNFLKSLEEILIFFKNYQKTEEYEKEIIKIETRKKTYELFLENLNKIYKFISSTENINIILSLNSLSITLGYCETNFIELERCGFFPYVSIYLQRLNDFINFYSLSNIFLITLDDICHLYINYKLN